MVTPKPGEYWQSAFYDHEIVEVIAIYPDQVYIKTQDSKGNLWKCPVSWFMSRYRRLSKLERYLYAFENEKID